MSNLQFIKGCPLFYELFDEEVDTILKDCNVACYDAGQAIVKEGDIGKEIYILLSGKASVQKNIANNIIEIAELNKGDVFGELVLINENTRTADVVTKEETDVLIIEYDTIFSLYKKNNKIFSLLVLNLSRLLTQRLKKSNIIVEELNRHQYE
jgi:CRP/FNR family cyclic AMP-dependent transcriptional regulator